MALEDVIPLPPRINQSPWYGQIASNPENLSDPVYVVIPAFDKKHRFGPCRWQSRDDTTMPQRGDEALIIFDNNRIPWVVAWWPFD
jgi:hypothetical protein